MGTVKKTNRGRDNGGDGRNHAADEQLITIRISHGRIVLLGVLLFVVAGILVNNSVLPSRLVSTVGTTVPGASSPAFSASSIQPAARTSSAYRCSNFTADPKHFKGQRGEDKKLLSYFGGLCGGTYMELGALDGVTFSNTYFFNKVLRWKGVLIELGPKNYEQLARNRPDELAVVNAGICEKRRIVHYIESGAVGGIVEFAADSFKKYWWTGRVPLSKEQEIQCLPMNELLGEKVGETFYFDFLSLDVEGAEFEVLKTLDFNRYGFGIIFVEADDHDERKNLALRALLVANGYTQFEPRSDMTDWFVNNQFHHIYEDLLHAAAAPAAPAEPAAAPAAAS